MKNQIAIAEALLKVSESEDGLYGVLLEHGSMELGYYQPRDIDDQEPHDQDEIYIVHRGHGSFFCDGTTTPFAAGDALFVAAGVGHRFLDFSDDFAAWVVFWGPDGGERGTS